MNIYCVERRSKVDGELFTYKLFASSDKASEHALEMNASSQADYSIKIKHLDEGVIEQS